LHLAAFIYPEDLFSKINKINIFCFC